MSDESLEQSGVESSGSDQSSASQPPAETQSDSAQQEAAAKESQESNVPFHQHPRWKEVMDERRQYKEQLELQSKQLQELQERLTQFQPKEQPKTDPLIDRLKSIDKEFGERFERLASLEDKFQAYNQWQQSLEMERTAAQAESKLDNLYKQHGVSDDRRPFYRQQVENTVFKLESQGKQVGVQDLDNIFKSVHENVSKFFNGYERKLRESYVADKKKDASIPATQTGGSAPAPAIKPGSMDAAARKAAIVAELMRGREKI